MLVAPATFLVKEDKEVNLSHSVRYFKFHNFDYASSVKNSIMEAYNVVDSCKDNALVSPITSRHKKIIKYC